MTRLLLPAPGFPPLFYEVNVSDEPAALDISGLDHRHRVLAHADVRADGDFALTATLTLGTDSATVRAALSQTGGGLASFAGTIGGQPFKFVNTPSHRPQSLLAPTLADRDRAVLVHWQGVARGLRVLAFALRSYESVDDSWSAAPCRLILGAMAVGVSSFLTATTDPAALDAYENAINAANAWLVQGNCVGSVAPLSDVEPG